MSTASLVRPVPITVLAWAYGAAGVACLVGGIAGSYSQPHYRLGELLLGPAAMRLFLLSFGAGLLFVAWGFHGLKAIAWSLFIYAVSVGLALEGLWLVLGIGGGTGSLRYLPHLAVDVALLAYVYKQRGYFIH
ncbi:MAG: hypothetical protein HY814_10095 [Candidatus Riflebacteria bacterium]|nr:hypothetical protein [Candidatus Riflebacteria bacterium]